MLMLFARLKKVTEGDILILLRMHKTLMVTSWWQYILGPTLCSRSW